MDFVVKEEISSVDKDTGFKFFLKNFHLLFFKPRLFFKDLDLLNVPILVYVSLWLIGMSNAVDRIDQKLMKSDLGTATSSNQFMLDAISGGWLVFFLIVAGIGALGAFFVWLIGGWFYNLRLSWSGAGDFDKVNGRLIYVFSSLVTAIPHIITLLISATLYQDYVDVFYADEYWSSLIIIFPFWAIYVSYTAILTNFTVVKWKAMLWFVILPILFYSLAFGVVVLAYSLA
ncbi:MAG: hypothetical protein WBC60_12350 [Cognaticolwellia sp.]